MNKDDNPNPSKAVAIVREVSNTYNDCCLEYNERQPIDIALAKRQHRAYVDSLNSLGLEVRTLPPEHNFPDACFVEDTAVFLDHIAVITWPGTATRSGEERSVAACLRHTIGVDVEYMRPPAQLEGGDVLKIGKMILVGQSRRTNRLGFEFLRHLAGPLGYEVVPVPVHGALHLKTAVTYIGRSTLVATSVMADVIREHTKDLCIVTLVGDDAYAANLLAVGDTVLVPNGFPNVRTRIETLGFETRELNMSEFRKGEAGLTCLSIIIPLEQSSRKRLAAYG